MTIHPVEEDESICPLLDEPDGADYLTKVMEAIQAHWNLGRIQPVYFSPLHFILWYEEVERWEITREEITRVAKAILARQPFKDAFPTISDVLDMARPHRYEAPIESRPEIDPESVARRKKMIAAARQQLKESHE